MYNFQTHFNDQYIVHSFLKNHQDLISDKYIGWGDGLVLLVPYGITTPQWILQWGLQWVNCNMLIMIIHVILLLPVKHLFAILSRKTFICNLVSKCLGILCGYVKHILIFLKTYQTIRIYSGISWNIDIYNTFWYLLKYWVFYLCVASVDAWNALHEVSYFF